MDDFSEQLTFIAPYWYLKKSGNFVLSREW